MGNISVGKDKDFNTINEAVAYSNDGDSVLIYPGSYYEQVIVEDKIINLIGVRDESGPLVKILYDRYPIRFIYEDPEFYSTYSGISVEGLYIESYAANYPTFSFNSVDNSNINNVDILIHKCYIKSNLNYIIKNYNDTNFFGTLSLTNCDISYSGSYVTSYCTYFDDFIMDKCLLNKKCDFTWGSPSYLNTSYDDDILYGKLYNKYSDNYPKLFNISGNVSNIDVIIPTIKVFNSISNALVNQVYPDVATGDYSVFVQTGDPHFVVCQVGELRMIKSGIIPNYVG